MAIASTGIQSIVEQMIWALLTVEEPAGRAMTDRAGASWLADRLDRLARRTELDAELADEVVEFAAGAKTVFQVRNDNLHGVWVALEDGDVVRLRSVLVDGREGPDFQTNLAVAAEGQLASAADAMEEFARRAYELLERVRAATDQ